MILPIDFYLQDDVVSIAKQLLGKVISTHINGIRTSGMIVETEAYKGITDKASHAYMGRKTKRTAPMFEQGGIAYVYLCYGIHSLFNVVTNIKDVPHAILIRAIEPLEGIEFMLERSGQSALKPSITAGPGVLSEALGITSIHSGESLLGKTISIEDRNVIIEPNSIVSTTRVGVAYAAEDALLPYRFYLSGNRYVSKGKGL
ncbi:MAG TPA: DNA-3-methyladenine glycosylase [Flavipsychrobacter sp.]|jgi:DNA-3-methyladenine glycosylase|nr:DNA-3-methyladenine glycosylase [Flavipsychrobacter sp.]